MVRKALTVLFCTISLTAFSQKVSFVNPNDIFAEAQLVSDTGNYDHAIKLYKQIDERDTSYVMVLTELTKAYINASKYDSALTICKKALDRKTENRAELLRLQALAIARQGNVPEGIRLLKIAQKEFPVDPRLYFVEGLVYYNDKQYSKARDVFFNLLKFSPFHSSSHLYLGLLSILEGRKTHAMLSFGMYLSVNNEDNSRLVLLNNMLDNQVSDEGSLKAEGTNGAEKLDQILRAKIAMDKKFDSKIPINAPVVRQYEMMFTQLQSLNNAGDDPWMNYYLPIYKAILADNVSESFIYHIMGSSQNEIVLKWQKKNQDKLKAFYATVNRELGIYNKKVKFPALGFTDARSAEYENNIISGIGERDADGNATGEWIYFHDNFVMSARGKYDAGKKSGLWKYYNRMGVLKSQQNYETGEVHLFYPSGRTEEHFYMKGDVIDGKVEVFHECGTKSMIVHYTNGERNGVVEEYYPDGTLSLKYTLKEGKAEGELVSYHENGALKSRKLFTGGALNGKALTYYPNGKLSEEGEYLNHEAVGFWKYYHDNGQLDYSGSYVKGIATGEWKYYNRRGELIETRTLDDEGRLHGDDTYYYQGKPYVIYTMKNGIVIKVRSVDENGKELGSFENSKGNFKVKTYFPTGEIQSEGTYVKGKRSGNWRWYHRNGKLKMETAYAEGLAEGKSTEYFKSGEVRYQSNYKNDELEGALYEFYKSGKLRSEGWFVDGVKNQRSLFYYADGSIESDYYYINGKAHGDCYQYAIDGKLTEVVTYNYDELRKIVSYDTKGIDAEASIDSVATITSKFNNGKLRFKIEYACSNHHGAYVKYLPSGKPYYQYASVNGKRNGAYQYRDVMGDISVQGEYVNGSESGLWNFYDEKDKLSATGKFVNGDHDSTWVYYYPNGKIQSITQFLADEREGLSQHYSPNGLLLLEKFYAHDDVIRYRVKQNESWGEWISFKGTGKIIANYPDGKVAIEEDYKDYLRDGVRKVYYPNGKVCEEFYYKNGDNEGGYTYYYENGKVREKGTYVNDSREGKREYFYETGSPKLVEEYKLGLHHGKTLIYDQKGKATALNFWSGFLD